MEHKINMGCEAHLHMIFLEFAAMQTNKRYLSLSGVNYVLLLIYAAFR